MIDFNNLSETSYKFQLERAPNVEYRVQQAQIPGVSLGSVEIPTPFTKIPLPGNISYDDFTITFMVAEHMLDYLEILNWMVSIGQDRHLGQMPKKFADTMSDATLTVLDSQSKPIYNVNFVEMFPVSLSPLNFNVSITGPQYVEVTASFKYTRFSVNKVT